jgi:biopolymer transport protein ExbB
MNDIGLSHFLDQLDPVGRFVLMTLVGMSLASWSVILFKLVQFRRAARMRNQFFERYRSVTTPAVLRDALDRMRSRGCAAIARSGFEALGRWRGRGEQRLLEASDGNDFVSAWLARAVYHERKRLENGLTLLATIGSTAPFLGLLGTVWGIYHALIAISATGQGTLDKVAGPVGEALIMTAIGLSVAIPAVLAYNTCVRALVHVTGDLDDFVQELLGFMTTGVPASSPAQSEQPAGETAWAGRY